MDLERFTVKDMQRKSKQFLDLLDSGKEIFIRGITVHKKTEKCPELVYTEVDAEKNLLVETNKAYIPPEEEHVYDERGDEIYGEPCSMCGEIFKRNLWVLGFEDGEETYECDVCMRHRYGKFYSDRIKKHVKKFN